MSATMYGSTAGAGAGQAIFTDDVSLQVFMEHLKRLVSVVLSFSESEMGPVLMEACVRLLVHRQIKRAKLFRIGSVCVCVCVLWLGVEGQLLLFGNGLFCGTTFLLFISSKNATIFFYLLSRARIRRKHGTFVSTWTEKALFA